jgi:hypothetical protein
MSKEQIGGVIRTLLGVGAGLLINRGLVDAATAEAIVGGLVAILVALWSMWTNRPAKIAAIK